MSDDWVPFGLHAEAVDQYRVLEDGVPDRMREPLLGWLRRVLEGDRGWTSVGRTQALEMQTSLPVGLAAGSWVKIDQYVAGYLRSLSEDQLLRAADGVLALNWYSLPTDALDQVLAMSRSKWSVGERMGKPGLVARVPEGVQDVVEATIASAGTAGQILARAWAKVHGLEADDPGAYADAVKAVERAAKPLVEPNNDDGTLSSIIGAMLDHGDWRLPLREHKLAPTADTIVAMCRTLWRGHLDRHATAEDYRDVTHEEALAAVALAATLVSWFSDGLIERRSS